MVHTDVAVLKGQKMADAELDMILADMRQEFIESCEDRLDNVEETLALGISGHRKIEDVILDVKRNIHSVKGLGTSFGFSSVSLLAHASEDYIETSADPRTETLQDIQLYIDRIREILDSGIDPGDDKTAEIIHSLPLFGRETASKSLRGQDIRLLFLMPKGIQRKIIGRELSSFGFKVVIAETGISAIDLAITHKPDIIISSMVVGRLSGIELANIFNSIETTFHSRFLLVTASDPSEQKFEALPKGTTILRKGMNISKDLYQFLRDNSFIT